MSLSKQIFSLCARVHTKRRNVDDSHSRPETPCSALSNGYLAVAAPERLASALALHGAAMDLPIAGLMDEDACYARLVAWLPPDGQASPVAAADPGHRGAFMPSSAISAGRSAELGR